MRARVTVIVISTVLAVPLTWFAIVAMYMPQPMAALANVILAPLWLFDWLSPNDPSRTLSSGVRWSITIVGQLMWFWILGLLLLELWRLVIRWRGRGRKLA
jgi:hypothetical protein